MVLDLADAALSTERRYQSRPVQYCSLARICVAARLVPRLAAEAGIQGFPTRYFSALGPERLICSESERL